MKRALTCLLLLLMTVTLYAAEYRGSNQSSKYHYPSCRLAQNINASNLVKFSTPEAAKRAGFDPCQICKPPVAVIIKEKPRS
ncbi:MAG TPA: Ada metal-binding domain-containing protein [Geobacterales bacterium]|nr:Ada metal-binding domain-containing protein [Geobacterales bacterium]